MSIEYNARWDKAEPELHLLVAYKHRSYRDSPEPQLIMTYRLYDGLKAAQRAIAQLRKPKDYYGSSEPPFHSFEVYTVFPNIRRIVKVYDESTLREETADDAQ